MYFTHVIDFGLAQRLRWPNKTLIDGRWPKTGYPRSPTAQLVFVGTRRYASLNAHRREKEKYIRKDG
eukprot:gene11666-38741_t